MVILSIDIMLLDKLTLVGLVGEDESVTDWPPESVHAMEARNNTSCRVHWAHFSCSSAALINYQLKSFGNYVNLINFFKSVISSP